MHFPIGIFGVAIATAALPTLSSYVSKGETAELRQTLSSSLRMVFLLNIPASAGLIFLSHPIISLIYEHGRFKPSDTHSTAGALVFYSIGLFAYSAVKLLVPVFYALGRSRVPVIISASAVASNIVLNLSLIRPFGYRGLALGTSMTSILNFLLLFHWLQKYLGPLGPYRLVVNFVKTCMASVAMGTVCFYTNLWLRVWWPSNSILSQGSVLSITIGIGILSLVFACRVLRISEIDSVIRTLVRRKKP